MATAILESDRAAIARAIEHDSLAEDHARERLLLELFAESGAVPEIAGRLHSVFLLTAISCALRPCAGRRPAGRCDRIAPTAREHKALPRPVRISADCRVPDTSAGIRPAS